MAARSKKDSKTSSAPSWGDNSTLGLYAEDWSWATWRRKGALTRGEQQEFDPKSAFALVAGAPARAGVWEKFVGKTNDYWREQRLPLAMMREHAHFWWEALSARHNDIKPKDRPALIAKVKLDGRVKLADAKKELKSPDYVVPEQINALAQLLDTRELLSLLFEKDCQRWSLLEGFRKFVFPFLDDGELEGLKKKLRPEVSLKMFPKDVYACSNGGGLSDVFFFAAAVGMHPEMKAIAESWTEDHFTDYRWCASPELMVFGLGSAKDVVDHFRRQRLKLKEPSDIRAWLAHTEATALSEVTAAIVAQKNKADAAQLAEELARATAPEVAEQMIVVQASSKAPQVATKWLERNAPIALKALPKVARGRGAVAEGATKALERLKALSAP